MRSHNLLGRRFGKLIVLHKMPNNKHGKVMWLCRCDCGETKSILSAKLLNGESKSCGCRRREVSALLHRTHGLSKTRIHRIWCAMKTRCYNPNSPAFVSYGAKGITVCRRWKTSFQHFLADMGQPPTDSHTLDRVDNTKGYTPKNCRWATYKEQSVNSRTPVMITFDGKTRCIADWARSLGISNSTLHERLRKWPIERALTNTKTHRWANYPKST